MAHLPPENATGSHEWKQERCIGGGPEDPETRSLQLTLKFAEAITSDMTAPIIRAAPQPGMLGNRNDEATVRGEAGVDRGHGRVVLLDVFENVVGADKIEGAERWNVPGIHLYELSSPPQASSRVDEPARMKFGARETRPIAQAREGIQHETGAAADLEVVLRFREVSSCEACEQAVARLEPVVPPFRQNQPVEGAHIEPNRLPGEGGGE